MQALVAARLDALTTAERKVVTDASVLGVSFTVDGLLALGTKVEDVESVLESLRRKEIVMVQTDRLSRRARSVPVRPVGGPAGRLRDPVPS